MKAHALRRKEVLCCVCECVRARAHERERGRSRGSERERAKEGGNRSTLAPNTSKAELATDRNLRAPFRHFFFRRFATSGNSGERAGGERAGERGRETQREIYPAPLRRSAARISLFFFHEVSGLFCWAVKKSFFLRGRMA